MGLGALLAALLRVATQIGTVHAKKKGALQQDLAETRLVDQRKFRRR